MKEVQLSSKMLNRMQSWDNLPNICYVLMKTLLVHSLKFYKPTGGVVFLYELHMNPKYTRVVLQFNISKLSWIIIYKAYENYHKILLLDRNEMATFQHCNMVVKYYTRLSNS